MKRLFSFMLLLSIVLPSCYKIVDTDFSEIKPQLVLLSFFTPDSVFSVRVSRTVGLNEFDNADTLIWLDDAVCSLFVDNNFFQLLSYRGNGWYVSPTSYHPQVGKIYKLRVWHPNYGSIEADSYVPLAVSISKVDSLGSMEVIIDGSREAYLKYGFTFTDNPEQHNYYELYVTDIRPKVVYQDFFSEEIDTVYIDTNLLSILTYSPILSENQRAGSYMLFSDKNIYNQMVTLSFMVNENSKTAIGGYLIKNLQVYLRTLSPEAYKYKLQILRYMNSDEDSWSGSQIIIPQYSNVKGGYGIFAGYNETIDTISFPVSLDRNFIDSVLNLY